MGKELTARIDTPAGVRAAVGLFPSLAGLLAKGRRTVACPDSPVSSPRGPPAATRRPVRRSIPMLRKLLASRRTPLAALFALAVVFLVAGPARASVDPVGVGKSPDGTT